MSYTRDHLLAEAEALVGKPIALWFEAQSDNVLDEVMAEMGEPLWMDEGYLRALSDAFRIVCARHLIAQLPGWKLIPK